MHMLRGESPRVVLTEAPRPVPEPMRRDWRLALIEMVGVIVENEVELELRLRHLLFDF